MDQACRGFAIICREPADLLRCLGMEGDQRSAQGGVRRGKGRGRLPFRNAGDKPLRIVSVATSCGCLAAKPEKETYAPGESGEIRAELDLQRRVGVQSRTITVTTDDASQQTTILTLLVEIPEPVIIRPRLLSWGSGTKPEEKSAEIVVTDPRRVTLVGFQCSIPLFEARLEARSTAGNYLLYVKPQETNMAKDAVIRLTATVAGRPQTFLIFLAVK
jgi:hypothetical protein